MNTTHLSGTPAAVGAVTTDDQLRERFAHLGAERAEQIVAARNSLQAELARNAPAISAVTDR